MSDNSKSLQEENEALRDRLAEAEAALTAIRNGEVDALLIQRDEGDQIYTLEGSDTAYRLLVENMSEGAVNLLEDGSILYSNQRFAEMIGWQLAKLIGSRFDQFVHPDDRETFDALILECCHGKNAGELRILSTDGAHIPVYISFNILDIHDIQTICLVITDLSEQKRNERIAADERLARAILDQAAECVVVCDDHGRIIRASQEVGRFYDGNPLLQPFTRVFPVHVAGSGEPFSYEPALAGDRIENHEVFLVQDGSIKTLLVNAGPLFDAEQRILGCVITLVDITERKHAEEQLKDLNRTLEQRVQDRTRKLRDTVRQLQSLAQQLTQAEEQERGRLAEILHDDIQQLLVAAMLHLSRVREYARDDPKFVSIVDENRKLINDTITKTRSLSHELSPPMFRKEGLVAALKWLCGQVKSKYDLTVRLRAEYSFEVAEPLKIFLFRAAQELLFNIVKHAQVREAEIELSRIGGDVQLIISDRGRGFDPNRIGPTGVYGTGYGLFSIQERIGLLGGWISIASSPGQGSRFILHMPLETPSPESLVEQRESTSTELP